MKWENAYKSLLGCMIGTISNIDLLHTRTLLQEEWNTTLESYYMLNVDAHCSMSLFEDRDIQ